MAISVRRRSSGAELDGLGVVLNRKRLAGGVEGGEAAQVFPLRDGVSVEAVTGEALDGDRAVGAVGEIEPHVVDVRADEAVTGLPSVVFRSLWGRDHSTFERLRAGR